MRRLRFLAEVLLCRVVIATTRIFPRRWLLAVGELTGLLGYWLDSRHRRITKENLRLALGQELSPAERDRIAKACWRNLGRNIFEMLSFGNHGPGSIGTIVHHEGLQHIRDAYAQDRGVLLFSAHFGHWELTALMQGYLDLPLTLVTRPLDNPMLERLLADLRNRSGNNIIHKRNAVREIIHALRARGGVAIVIDQDARDQGIFVPFFHQLASTTPTLARLAMRTGAAIVPTFSVPQPDGSYITSYLPALELEYSGDRDKDAIMLTSEATAIIEAWVRRHPEHWFGWMHRRWKTLPPDTLKTGDS
jgi:KDO2-lipid IV(A) lauroyltransferase